MRPAGVARAKGSSISLLNRHRRFPFVILIAGIGLFAVMSSLLPESAGASGEFVVVAAGDTLSVGSNVKIHDSAVIGADVTITGPGGQAGPGRASPGQNGA